MRVMHLVLLGTIVVVAAGGCRGGSTASDAAKAPSGSASAPASGAPAMNEATKAACTAMKTDIDTTLTELAKAEQIGPPAGHHAVSAQYSAGAAALYAHMIPANGAVRAAADKVADAMTNLADAYRTPPATAPDKSALNGAIDGLKAACATG